MTGIFTPHLANFPSKCFKMGLIAGVAVHVHLLWNCSQKPRGLIPRPDGEKTEEAHFTPVLSGPAPGPFLLSLVWHNLGLLDIVFSIFVYPLHVILDSFCCFQAHTSLSW